MEVRPEAIGDRSAVRALHVAAFGEDHVPVLASLVDELRDAVRRGEGLSLAAAERDRIVGHVLFSPSLLDAPKRSDLYRSPLDAVLEPFEVQLRERTLAHASVAGRESRSALDSNEALSPPYWRRLTSRWRRQ